MSDRELALGIRQAALMFLDYFEKWLKTKGWWDKTLTATLRNLDKSK